MRDFPHPAPSDLLEIRGVTSPGPEAPEERVPPRVYAVLGATTALTFATLLTSYELFFTRHIYA